MLTETPPAAARKSPSWEDDYSLVLVVLDTVAILAAAVAATWIRFGGTVPQVAGVSYTFVPVALVPAWILVLLASRAYEPRYLGTGSEEFKRVFNASVRFTALAALFAYTAKLALSRGFLGGTLIMGTALLLLERYAARKVVHLQRTRGRWTHKVLAVGDDEHVRDLATQLERDRYAGYQFAGSCAPDGVHEALARTGADTVAVTASPGISSDVLRRLAWSLEGRGVDFVVAPALTNVAGPRINIRPVAGLPLLHVEEPELTGGRQLLKSTVEVVVATLALLVLSPLLLVIALVVRLETHGPPLFRQVRVGRRGERFELYKFRSMVLDAEDQLDALLAANEADAGMLFKLRRDPRVTRVGRWLRRYSVDELPQLLNVVRGDMALVGPRPPLPAEVEKYGSDVRRRLLVKPGITGLWQVNGRSDLTWEESVRLDLYYVENWSLALDAMIIWKTLFAVLRGRGAY